MHALAPALAINLRSGPGSLLLRTLLHFVLTLFPGVAIGAYALRKGLRDIILAGLLELAGIGLTGYLAFWLWFASPRVGHMYSLVLPFVSGAVFVVNYKRLDAPGRRTMNHLLRVLAFVGAAALLIVSVGFVRGGFALPNRTAAERFSFPLPGDNDLPYLFAEGIRDGHVPKPLQADWLSSDRPPLQTACVLAQYAFLFKPRLLGYTVDAVILQSLWILAAWLLLAAFEIDRRAITLTLTVSLFSGFVFLNTFFVWPKLLAAAYILALLTFLFTPKIRLLATSNKAVMLAGSLLALGLLAHGASAFAVLGAAAMMPLFRRRIPVRKFALLIGTVAILYAPWTLYQKFYDPPGNFLLKMHLAGVDKIDSRSFPLALWDAYSSLTPREFVHNKIENLKTVFQNSGNFWIETVHLVTHLRTPDAPQWISGALRIWMFFHFVVNLGFLMIGPLALASGFVNRFRTTEWRAAAIMWLYVVMTTAIYVLLKFTPGTAIIHAGTYATVLLAYFASVLAFWAISRFLALAIGCLQMAVHILIYGLFMRPIGPHGLLPLAPVVPGCAALACFSLLAVIWLIYRLTSPAPYAHAPEILDFPPRR